MSARRAERARRLRMFALLVDQEAADLDGAVTPCECCGLNVAANRDERQWALNLAALTHKLRRVAAEMERKSAGVPEASGKLEGMGT